MKHILSDDKRRELHRAVETDYLRVKGVPTGSDITATPCFGKFSGKLIQVAYRINGKLASINVPAEKIHQLHRLAECEYLKSVGFLPNAPVLARPIRDNSGKITAIEYHQDPDIEYRTA